MQYRIRNGDSLLATVSAKSYHASGLTPNTSYAFSVVAFNGLRESSKETATVKTRGLQINVPTQLSTGATYNLTYEEYPLGLVPIGKEPAGFFGGGHKQNVPARVINSGSTSTLEITNSFNQMPDGLTMKQIADGSYAVYSGYKALFLNK